MSDHCPICGCVTDENSEKLKFILDKYYRDRHIREQIEAITKATRERFKGYIGDRPSNKELEALNNKCTTQLINFVFSYWHKKDEVGRFRFSLDELVKEEHGTYVYSGFIAVNDIKQFDDPTHELKFSLLLDTISINAGSFHSHLTEKYFYHPDKRAVTTVDGWVPSWKNYFRVVSECERVVDEWCKEILKAQDDVRI
jgi:hypothetical protein